MFLTKGAYLPSARSHFSVSERCIFSMMQIHNLFDVVANGATHVATYHNNHNGGGSRRWAMPRSLALVKLSVGSTGVDIQSSELLYDAIL